MSDKGWIKIHRKIQDCFIWDNTEPFDCRSAWIDLLLLANHKDVDILFNGEIMTICRGQYLTSVRKLSLRWGWTPKKTLKYLRVLEEMQMIKKESDNRKTLLTVEKYSIYQDTGNTKDNTDDNAEDNTDDPQTRIKELKNKRKNIKKKNTFNEFKQNVYDFDELEKKLIKN